MVRPEEGAVTTGAGADTARGHTAGWPVAAAADSPAGRAGPGTLALARRTAVGSAMICAVIARQELLAGARLCSGAGGLNRSRRHETRRGCGGSGSDRGRHMPKKGLPAERCGRTHAHMSRIGLLNGCLLNKRRQVLSKSNKVSSH